MLQAYDWWHLFNQRNVRVQIGGADQYGNLLSGAEAVKTAVKNNWDPLLVKKEESTDWIPFGFTTPLLTTSSGAKIGKSDGNALWLDSELTSPFEFYQVFGNL